MTRNWFENAAAILFVSALAGLAIGQRTSSTMPVNIPADSKFALQVDLHAIKHTKLGSMLFELAKKKAIEEINKEGDGQAGLAKLQEMLGMDPFEEIQSITLSSSEYESPEKSMLAIIQFKSTTGNLEGMVLGLPDYEVSEYKSHQIHSASQDKHTRVYGAIHGQADQARTLVVTPSKNGVQAVLDTLDGESGGIASGKTIELAGESSSLVRLRVFDIPKDKIGEGPQANIAKIVKTFMLDMQDAGEDIKITVKMTTETDKQAEQLRQMAQGLIAMIDFAQSMDSEDVELQKFRELLVGVEATREGSEVHVGLTIKSEKIAQALAAELDIPLETDAGKLEERKRLEQTQQELEAKLEATKKELERIK